MTDISDGSRKGWFQSLNQLVAFPVPVSHSPGLVKSFEDEGVFLLPAAVQQKIAGVRFPGLDNNTEQKVMNMLGYLAELTYDLCIAPGDNVSSNPGFETCLGVFG